MSEQETEGEARTPTLNIYDFEFAYTEPYVEGHVVNEAEARVLNQTRRENLANNFRPKVKKAIEDAGDDPVDVDSLTSEFAELDASYEFTIANVAASRKLDPVEKEARSIARNYIRQQLDLVGRKMKDVPEGMTKEEWDDALEAEIETISANPQVVQMAKDAVAARSGKIDLAINLGPNAA